MRDRRKPDEQQETGSRAASGSGIRPVAPWLRALASARRLARMASGLAVRPALTFAPCIPARVRAAQAPTCSKHGLDDTASLKYLLAR